MSDATPSRADIYGACQTVLLSAIRARGVGDADDIRRVVTIPPCINPSIVGRAIGALSRAGIIVPVEFITTSRPVGHAHLMRSWRLADPALGGVQ